MTNHPHTGQLQADAPGLVGALRRLYQGQDLEYLLSRYALACQLGALYETPVCRGFGASFNPRPSRICSLLISAEKEKNQTRSSNE